MQEDDRLAQPLFEHGHEQVAHFAILRENERLLALFDNFLEHLDKALRLAAAAEGSVGGLGVFGQERRVIADLLELGQDGKNQAATTNAAGGVDAAEHVGGDAFVHRRLLGGQAAEDAHFHLRRQVGGDFGLILGPPQNKGADHFL